MDERITKMHTDTEVNMPTSDLDMGSWVYSMTGCWAVLKHINDRERERRERYLQPARINLPVLKPAQVNSLYVIDVDWGNHSARDPHGSGAKQVWVRTIQRRLTAMDTSC